MKVVYRNTEHPELVKWSCIAAGIIGVVCIVLYIVFSQESLIFVTAEYTLFFILFFGGYKLSTYTFDDEADTIIFSHQKNYPLRLSGITTITYNENRKGKFRYLLIHDAGTGFMQIRTSKANADRMTAQILAANPSAVIKHANYI